MSLKNMEKWQKRKLIFSFAMVLIIGISFLFFTCNALYQDKMGEDIYWRDALEIPNDLKEDVEVYGADATRVTVGTYVENLKEINIKSSYFRVVFLAWFKWEGNDDLDMMNNFRIYKGLINKMEVVKEVHKGNEHYQLVRCDTTITKNYWTIRFPLESHQLRIYIEPNYIVNDVVLVPDTGQSGLNENLGISGFDIDRFETGAYAIRYDGTRGDPDLPADGNVVVSEHVTAMQINRSDPGLYVKCFAALVGTITWVMITLFICTYHYVDPLSMIPAALFGTVANVMVGANLLPDALQAGLIEYVNFWGVMMILMSAIVIININQIRKKQDAKASADGNNDKRNTLSAREFSKLYGRVLFYTILLLILGGNILLPVCAYLF